MYIITNKSCNLSTFPILLTFHIQQLLILVSKMTAYRLFLLFIYSIGITFISSLLTGCSNETMPTKKVERLANDTSIKDVFSNATTKRLLTDFEYDIDIQNVSNIGAEVEFRKTPSNKTLGITFQASSNISTVRYQPTKPWNLSIYEDTNLAFDVTNTSESSVQLYLSLENPEGKIQKRSISLPGGYVGVVYFPFSGQVAETDAGFWGDAPAWQTNDKLMVWRSWRADKVDVKQLAALNFFTIGILEDRNIEIDNIRLRANPPTDDDWLVGVVDKYGQNAKYHNELTVSTDAELIEKANQERKELFASTGMPFRSKFGGYTNAPKLKATGFFRTQKVDGKWWMVDPEGYLFFSHGPANVRMANMSTITGVDYTDPKLLNRSADEVTPEDSMGIVEISNDIRKTKVVTSALRNNMFEWLPDYDDPLANHYSYRRSTHKGPVPHGETYSFYRANLERRYGESTPNSFLKDWHDVTVERMKDWGFTSFGNWVDPAFYHTEKVPYFANGWIIGDFATLSGQKNHWGKMPDVFDPVFAQRAEHTISVIAKQVKASPWCIGIFIDNEKSWGERTGSVHARYGVVLDALSKESEASHAKYAFTNRLKTQYPSIDTLNAAWNTDFSSWQVFDQGVVLLDFSELLVADLSMLLEMLGEQYFEVVHSTLNAYLPDHLYMGARMANWGMPDEIIKASLKYSDVLSFNIYEEGVQPHFWDFLAEVDLPVTIGEFHIGATDSGLFNPGIVHAANQQDRADMYKRYMQSVIEKPYMVGAHWFQYIDEPVTGRAFDGENANIGFVTVTDIPYPKLIEAVKDVTSSMYQKRLGKTTR